MRTLTTLQMLKDCAPSYTLGIITFSTNGKRTVEDMVNPKALEQMVEHQHGT